MSPQIAWVALVTAGLLDVGWAISMKYADGYTRLGWSIASLALLAAFVLADVGEPHVEIAGHRFHQRLELAVEEMVGAGDDLLVDHDALLRLQLSRPAC
jgi:hypothetical protein